MSMMAIMDMIVMSEESNGSAGSTRLSEGVPFQEIVRIADEEDVGMIVLGTHGRSAIGEVLLGSVSQEVVRRARQSILVVPCARFCPTPE
jgi:nucleotide-binding universal stress UspA family protein